MERINAILTDLLGPLGPLFAVGTNPDLDQFVMFQCRIDLVVDVFAESLVAHHHHRAEFMGQSS